MAGVRGRRRLWKNKVEVDAFKEAKDDLKATLARLEERVWRLGSNKPQDPLSQETIDLVNQKG